jgi:outer membrane murein-binding lipoprotein Lpp
MAKNRLNRSVTCRSPKEKTMKRMLIAAFAAASMTLASCATMPTAAQVTPRVERAQAAYDRIAGAVEIILPYLSPERAARVRLAMALAERGLLAAKLAATAAEQLAALKQAEAATATIESTAGS